MKLDILNSKGEKTGRSIELAEDVFGIKPNDHVVYLAVKAYLANQRQGTHKTKERREVWRTTKKFKKQKHDMVHVEIFLGGETGEQSLGS